MLMSQRATVRGATDEAQIQLVRNGDLAVTAAELTSSYLNEALSAKGFPKELAEILGTCEIMLARAIDSQGHIAATAIDLVRAETMMAIYKSELRSQGRSDVVAQELERGPAAIAEHEHGAREGIGDQFGTADPAQPVDACTHTRGGEDLDHPGQGRPDAPRGAPWVLLASPRRQDHLLAARLPLSATGQPASEPPRSSARRAEQPVESPKQADPAWEFLPRFRRKAIGWMEDAYRYALRTHLAGTYLATCGSDS